MSEREPHAGAVGQEVSSQEEATPRVRHRGSSAEQPTSPALLQPATPTRGAQVAGRYTVLDTLGQGGMGVVVAAYDSKLDRRVALKLLGDTSTDGHAASLRTRLIREAQAMARLSHPNVVAVYDAGATEDGAVFIAMEFVEGQTLRQWLHEQPRTWRQVLAAYVAAGRGLAAAHEVGLVHRDFKPDNVLVGRDGRVRVTDFGVARAEVVLSASLTPSQPPTPASLALLGASAWESELTLPGSLVGTPRYLAPELLQGQAADARSDLYAFCVALYEALFQQPAFSGSTTAERMLAQREGRLNPPPPQSPVPGRVARLVQRGLEQERARRPVSMQELLAALEKDPEARRRSRLLTGALVAAVAVATGASVLAWERLQGPGCGQLGQRLAGVWDEERRGQVRQALLGSGFSFAASTAGRVEAALEQYTRRWVQLRAEVCEATRAQGGQPGPVALLQEACLEQRLGQVRTLVDMLAQAPDKALVLEAPQAVRALAPVEGCADIRALTSAVPLPEEPAVRARVKALQQQVDQLEVLAMAGRAREGVALGEQLLAQAGELDYAPLKARILMSLVWLKNESRDSVAAEELARQAVIDAARGQDDTLVALAWSRLMWVKGIARSRMQEALQMRLGLEVAVERSRSDHARASASSTLGNLFHRLGQYEQALTLQQQALPLYEKTLGAEHKETLIATNSVGFTLQALGRYEEALASFERSLELRERSLGPEHPRVALPLMSMAEVLTILGRYEEALARVGRAVAISEQFLGPEDPGMAEGLLRQGHVLMELGRYAQAQTNYERSLSLKQRTRNSTPLIMTKHYRSLGHALQEQGRYAEARTNYERARALAEQEGGPEHPEVAEAQLGLGFALLREGELASASPLLERALHLLEKSLGHDNPRLAKPLLALGELRLARGQPAQAVESLERALALSAPGLRAELQFTLARALLAAGRNRERALALATQAQQFYQRLAGHPRSALVARWLEEHSRP